MNLDSIRNYCLQKAGVEEGLPFGPDVLAFKVNGKIFLLLPLDTGDLRFNAKCDPQWAEELRESYAAITPGYHMNKQHWNTVRVDGRIPTTLVWQLIDHSYERVRGKKR